MTQPDPGIHFHPTRKGGLRPNDPAAPRLFLRETGAVRTAPEHPLTSDILTPVRLGMDLNDRYGTCVPTGLDNLRRAITQLLTGTATEAGQADIVAWYRTQNPGFNPGVPGGVQDEGMVIQDFLAWAVKQGLILGFAAVDVHDDAMLQAVAYLGMGPMNGLDLAEAQTGPQFDAGLWDYDQSSPYAGGHCTAGGVYSAGPAEEGSASWQRVVGMTARFLDRQRTEAWAVLFPAHVDHPGFREHFDLVAFAAAYTQITGRPFPVTVPTVEPTPTPVTPVPGGGGWFRLDPGVAAAVDHWTVKHHWPDKATAPNEILRRELHVHD